jgi:hypothetical protein
MTTAKSSIINGERREVKYGFCTFKDRGEGEELL